MKAICFNNKQELDADLKAMQKISFTGNLEAGLTAMFFINEEAKETTLNFSEGTVRVL